MGEFKSGQWIVGIALYFFAFFVVVNMVVSTLDYYSVDNDIVFQDSGFGSDPESYTGNLTVSPDGSYSFDTFLDSLSIITGINSNNVNIGVPSAFKYIFSFLFFWIPFLMMAWAIYMALPFLH